ncbi:MAG TPA: ZIP family metal transporter [Bryobacteraceae bacterium]|nr:ZIP family metal transporter [Bryobacteraceae bacterium]
MPDATLLVPALATGVGISGAVVGIWLTEARTRTRIVVPLTAGMLLGVALFGLLPELADTAGWPVCLGLLALGYAALAIPGRLGFSVCPSCSHTHDHGSCSSELHGFATPLLVGAALHSFFDGWSVGAAQLATPFELRLAAPIAIALHKAPEGIALGGILCASMKSRSWALVFASLAEGTTLVGAAIAIWLAPHFGTRWITYPLGVTAGWLCYLGLHAAHEEWKLRGPRRAFVSAAAGMAGAALILRGAESFFR